MCGIAGFLQTRPLSPTAGETGARMANAIAHRGPDDHGLWLDHDAGVVLAHRRLAVLDLSAAGHQPMVSASGRYVIVYNGEIYNHLDLREAIERSGRAPTWRGHSDTETLLALIECVGLREALCKSVGMFALALWDRTDRSLSLARDRIGEKPLYYGWQRGSLLFASDLAALRVHPSFEHRVDRVALSRFVDCGYVPAPDCIYEGIRKLPAGCVLTVGGGRAAPDTRNVRIGCYWSLAESARRAATAPFTGNLDEAADRLDTLLRTSLAGQMLSDVPLGAFLSGGTDSTVVVALMQQLSARPIRTFTIGFRESQFDEAPFARRVAEHLGTAHTEFYVTAHEAANLVNTMPHVYSEPLADSSQIATYLVSKLAREHVTVALSGDAGDELFCGYSRYFLTRSLWRVVRMLPRPARRGASLLVSLASPAAWTATTRLMQAFLPRHYRRPLLGDDLHKGRKFLSADSAMDLYRAMLSFVDSGESIVTGVPEPPQLGPGFAGWEPSDFFGQAMLLDGLTYLPDDILVKVDRAAMAVSLETRIPLLDHRIVEFAWSLPAALRVSGDRGKLPLRRLLSRYVPEALVERPKMGFSVPIDDWLRGPLRPWAEDLLDATRLANDGFFDVALVRRKWLEHLGGRRNWQFLIWSVLMFQAWLIQARQDRNGARTLR